MTVAEDSGLASTPWAARPVFSRPGSVARTRTYPEKFALIYKGSRGRGSTTSTARFVCALPWPGTERSCSRREA